jgi:hypothetical protein
MERVDFLSSEESRIIAERVLCMEDYVKSLGSDKYALTGENSLTGRYYCFNFMSDETIYSILGDKLTNLFGRCIIQCWANIFRKGEGIGEHQHTGCMYDPPGFRKSVNIFLSGDPSIGTYYQGVKCENKVGELSMFPPIMKHSVPENPTDHVRISLAMDVYAINVKTSSMLKNEPMRYILLTREDET